MTHDWVKIEHDFVANGMTREALAKKYHASANTVAKHANDGNWKKKREEFCEETARKLREKSSAKTAAKVMSEEEKKTEIRALILSRTLEHLKRDDIDTQDLRRCQQIYTDLTLDDKSDEELHPLMRELVELEKNDKQ